MDDRIEPVEGTDELIPRLQAAVAHDDPEAITEEVKRTLADLIRRRRLRFSDRFRKTRDDTYARRLLYRDPETGTTAVVMTWGPGQTTPLHDHAGIWCVEGVVEGEMSVARFEKVDEDSEGRCRFIRQGNERVGPGSAGALIPPFEYHVLGNAMEDGTSITLHVYGGELEECSVFEPLDDGRFQRVTRSLSYHD